MPVIEEISLSRKNEEPINEPLYRIDEDGLWKPDREPKRYDTHRTLGALSRPLAPRAGEEHHYSRAPRNTLASSLRLIEWVRSVLTIG